MLVKRQEDAISKPLARYADPPNLGFSFLIQTSSTKPASEPALALLGALKNLLVECIRSAVDLLARLPLRRLELSGGILAVGVELCVEFVGFGLSLVALLT